MLFVKFPKNVYIRFPTDQLWAAASRFFNTSIYWNIHVLYRCIGMKLEENENEFVISVLSSVRCEREQLANRLPVMETTKNKSPEDNGLNRRPKSQS